MRVGARGYAAGSRRERGPRSEPPNCHLLLRDPREGEFSLRSFEDTQGRGDVLCQKRAPVLSQAKGASGERSLYRWSRVCPRGPCWAVWPWESQGCVGLDCLSTEELLPVRVRDGEGVAQRGSAARVPHSPSGSLFFPLPVCPPLSPLFSSVLPPELLSRHLCHPQSVTSTH